MATAASASTALSPEAALQKKRKRQAAKQRAYIASILVAVLTALAVGSDTLDFFLLESRSWTYWVSRGVLVLTWLGVVTLMRMRRRRTLSTVFSFVVWCSAAVWESWDLFWGYFATRPAAFWITRLLILLLWIVLITIVGCVFARLSHSVMRNAFVHRFTSWFQSAIGSRKSKTKNVEAPIVPLTGEFAHQEEDETMTKQADFGSCACSFVRALC